MKTIKSLALILLGVLCMTSCELDNYDFPESSLHGTFFDQETGEAVQSDIFDGTRIGLVEIDEAYENAQKRYLIVKTDGTYQNDLMFDGLYGVPSIEDGNFHPTDSTSITVDGDTEIDFQVLPYIRITDVVFTTTPEDAELIATFKLEQTVPDSIHILDVSIFAHTEPTVGRPHRLSDEGGFLGAAAVADSTYSITWKVGKDRALDEEDPFYYRVGAIIDMPGAKYNYAPAERIIVTPATE
ncbi:MAG: DUF3823 domain-containing protein [Bacteroidales bacterium]|jgi:hypothetical protein|nr:DUF3823 domain-containing protein [Bacteroidales bacterium]